MTPQIKSSFKKEVLAFTRTKRFLILACVFIGWAVFSPILLKGLSALMDSMSDTYSEYGMDVSAITEELNSVNATAGVMSAMSELSQLGILVFLLLICGFAGGEQKKRSVIIPQTSGLSSFAYLFPKFIIYPLTVFVFSVAGTAAASAVSVYIFDYNDIVIGNVLAGGAVLGVYLMFYVCAHLCLGTATGQAGMSAAVCIAASLLLPNIFVLADADMYNPFTLYIKGIELAGGGKMTTDVMFTILVTFVVIVLLFFIALFAQNAKKIDNSGDEVFI